MRIQDPNAPADCGITEISCVDGDVRLHLIDDSKSCYTGLLIEREGIKVRRIIMDGVVIWERTETPSRAEGGAG